MFVAVSCHMLTAVAPTNWTNRPANSILAASSSTPRMGGGTCVQQFDPQVGRCVVPAVEERLAHRHLTGAGHQDDRVLRWWIRHLIGRCDQNVHFAVRTQVELVEMSLNRRAGSAFDRSLADRRAEGETHVGGLAPGADESVAPVVVERAETVKDIGVVDQQLPVLALGLEQLRVQGVGLSR